MGKKFQKNKEDFVCEKCGEKVKGSGYTNHCPKCLWSKHTDIYPGDREEGCKGMMEPINMEYEGRKIFIIHECKECGVKKRNRISDDDNIEALLKK